MDGGGFHPKIAKQEKMAIIRSLFFVNFSFLNPATIKNMLLVSRIGIFFSKNAATEAAPLLWMVERDTLAEWPD